MVASFKMKLTSKVDLINKLSITTMKMILNNILGVSLLTRPFIFVKIKTNKLNRQNYSKTEK